MKLFTVFVSIILLGLSAVIAQTIPTVPLDCGAIAEGELTADQASIEYIINTSAGTRITLVVESIGDSFNPYLVLLDSGGSQMFHQNATVAGESEELIDYTISSTNSVLRLWGADPDYANATEGYNIPRNDVGMHYGAYLISLDCTLRDGTRIPAGSIAPVGGQPPAVSRPDNGFSGLPPVDFADGISIPLTLNTPNSGAINPGFASVFGFTFDGTEGQTVSLDFTRIAGNLNLGLAVVYNGNQTAFFTALVTSRSMSTEFVLPATAQYTIGVFQVDLVPPSLPEATSFTVQVSPGQ